VNAAPLPVGFRLALDPAVKLIRPDLLFGGSPPRFLRLNPAGLAALDELRGGAVGSRAAAVLARRLTDVGMADPRPGTAVEASEAPEVTVVIPIRDRADELRRCLDTLGSRYPVVVVDDGSLDPEAVAKVAVGHGARVVRLGRNGGPGSARNFGCQVVETDLVAFLDSDCVPGSDWIAALAPHFADPLVAAVAPRIVAVGLTSTVAARYGAARSPLDLGPRAARVRPLSPVSYVPTAALVIRRSALIESAGFDEALRYGEDVDLIWRFDAAGWRVRYDPSVTVGHQLPEGWGPLLRRRYAYGTSAAPLALRHPGLMASLVLSAWPTAAVLAVLARRPVAAAVAYGTGVALLARRLRPLPAPPTQTLATVAAGVGQTWLGLGRGTDQFAWPAVLVALAGPGPGPTGRRLARRLALAGSGSGLTGRRSGRPRVLAGRSGRPRVLAGRSGRPRVLAGRSGRPRVLAGRSGRRLALLALVVSPPLVEWWRRRPALDPLRFVAGYLADEAAYGLGVYRGCVRHRTWAPLRPRLLVGRSGEGGVASAWHRPPAERPLPDSSSSTRS
jgi:mycofactocin glycosyltransferase